MNIDIQGHRGARGLAPENSLPAFNKALDFGVTTLELDVVITGDKRVLVSHEPWISSEICQEPGGGDIAEDSARMLNIYKMSFSEIKGFDCGSKGHPRFPKQEKMAVSKPLLSEVFIMAEERSIRPNYNIEIKSHPDGDDLYHPVPAEFVELVVGEILKYLPLDRFSIQSFDFRILKYLHEHYPDIKLAVLIENQKASQDNLAELGFIPQIYSCDYTLLTKEEVSNLQSQGMKVIPWTVNEVEDMTRLLSWGVDGMITDYPDRAQQFNSQ